MVKRWAAHAAHFFADGAANELAARAGIPSLTRFVLLTIYSEECRKAPGLRSYPT